MPRSVSKPGSVAALFDKVKQTHGRIDLLFNTAGTRTRRVPFED
jgi:NAD(P)-dependent dehydrogenase (short-subunit alcohol dehydrogenase family)